MKMAKVNLSLAQSSSGGMLPRLLLLVLLSVLREASGYCWAAGRNPGFSGPPVVTQVRNENNTAFTKNN